MARQALNSRSNRAGTLGVTPGATSRHERATDLQSSCQNDSLSGLKEFKKETLSLGWDELSCKSHHPNVTTD